EDESLQIMSTDSNIEFCGSYPSAVGDPGLAGIQGRSFYELVRKLPPGEMTVRTDSEVQHVMVQHGRRNYKLPVNDPNWFQSLSVFPETAAAMFSGDFLHEIIDKVAYCISDEDSMEAIACMFMAPAEAGPGEARIEVCGLNGHQFAMFNFVNEDIRELLPQEGVLIQKKYLLELKKWLTFDEIEMSISDKRLFFRSAEGRETFSFPLSYYQFPNYHNFLAKLNDEGVSTFSANREELIEALERILIFNTDANRCTYFEFSPEEAGLTIQGLERGSAEERIECSYAGDMKRIAFPTRNFIEILGHFGSEKVTLTLTGAEAPCGVSGESDHNYQVIIMPMKIEEETYYSEEEV
ncbi:MAG: DNA polymerase III subunit beta, partial [Desulfovibrionaceae bacterium]